MGSAEVALCTTVESFQLPVAPQQGTGMVGGVELPVSIDTMASALVISLKGSPRTHGVQLARFRWPSEEDIPRHQGCVW